VAKGGGIVFTPAEHFNGTAGEEAILAAARALRPLTG